MPSGFPGALVGSEIYLSVFRRSQKSFNEHVVSPAPLAVHADFDVLVLQSLYELETRKLTILVRIHDIWDALLDTGLSERGDAGLSACIVFESLHASILRLYQPITATRYKSLYASART
jgi:hypothetical protein